MRKILLQVVSQVLVLERAVSKVSSRTAEDMVGSNEQSKRRTDPLMKEFQDRWRREGEGAESQSCYFGRENASAVSQGEGTESEAGEVGSCQGRFVSNPR
ncbi:hypothetical protein C8J56DRAFT_921444 [Mycena floridula]|nr:hypothetical protein C8J56DRAFT_921444 [Mycena floridula]